MNRNRTTFDADATDGSDVVDPVVERDRKRRNRIHNDTDEHPPTQPQCLWEDLTGFQRDLVRQIMVIERQGENLPTGQEIRRQLEDDYSTSVNHGRLYQNLSTLEEEGFVDKVPVDGRTNAYYLRDGAYEVLTKSLKELADACGLPFEVRERQ